MDLQAHYDPSDLTEFMMASLLAVSMHIDTQKHANGSEEEMYPFLLRRYALTTLAPPATATNRPDTRTHSGGKLREGAGAVMGAVGWLSCCCSGSFRAFKPGLLKERIWQCRAGSSCILKPAGLMLLCKAGWKAMWVKLLVV